MIPFKCRFRGVVPPSHQGPPGRNDDPEAPERPSVVKDRDLEDFDRLAINDGGWARTCVEIDYSERLVFSDEEDNTDKRFNKIMSSFTEP